MSRVRKNHYATAYGCRLLTDRNEYTIKHAIILAFAILAMLPVPRCRVEHARGYSWLVCPRNAGSYTYDDVYQEPLWRGGR